MNESTVHCFANWGPLDGPIRVDDWIACMGVLDDRGRIVGMTMPGPSMPDLKGGWGIATFRLTVHKAALPGYYVCDRRRFVYVEGSTPPMREPGEDG